jgi:glycosyltransferase involved in cell wall biosynthesis
MDEAERAEFGARAMERVRERYSWDAVTDKYEGVLGVLGG